MKRLAIILLAVALVAGVWWWMTKPGELSLPPLPEPPATEAPAPEAPAPEATAPEAPAEETTDPATAEDDFDAAALIDRVAASDINEAQKTSLTALINAAANDTALRPSVLSQVEAALQ